MFLVEREEDMEVLNLLLVWVGAVVGRILRRLQSYTLRTRFGKSGEHRMSE